jgi:hypothetical protein
VSFYLMHRGWMESEVFANEPYTEREAWEWMIGAANWEAGNVPVRGRPVWIERGQLCHSLRFMAEKFTWSKKKVECFLEKLTVWNMIKTAKGTDQTVITICNYGLYQDYTKIQGDSQGYKRGTAGGQQGDKEEPLNQLTKDTHFRKIYDLGSAAFPNLATRHTEIINRWIDAGADPEKDFTPLLLRHAGKNINSWNFFTAAVMDAIATRTQPLPKGTPNATHQPNSSGRPGKSEAARAAILEGLGLSPEG